MTANEAFELISNVTPCWDCKYKNSSCNREKAHSWTDGFCHEFEEAISVLAEVISNSNNTEPEPEPDSGTNTNPDPNPYNPDEDE